MRRYTPGDLVEVNGWYRAHGEPEMPQWAMPLTGFIEPGVGAGFVYLTNAPGIAFLENVVTNPVASAERRHAALVEIGDALMAEARHNGAKLVIGICKEECVARRGEERYRMRRLGKFEIVSLEVQ